MTSQHKKLKNQHKDLTRRQKSLTSQRNYLTNDGRNIPPSRSAKMFYFLFLLKAEKDSVGWCSISSFEIIFTTVFKWSWFFPMINVLNALDFWCINFNLLSLGLLKIFFSLINYVPFIGEVPVSKVTLTPTQFPVIAGQQMNLTCTTSYSNPAANITWIKSSEDITDQSTHTTDSSGGLVRTVSSLLFTVVQEDNGKQVFCRTSNTQDKSVSSTVHILNIMCKYTELSR